MHESPSDSDASRGARRPSLLASFSPEFDEDKDADLRLQTQLAREVLEVSPTAELAHVVLAGILAIQFWPSVGNTHLLIWVSCIAAATLVRLRIRLHLVRRESITAEGATVLRFAVLLTGVAWAAGPATLWPELPLIDLLLIMVVFAGLVAGATSTLVGDPPSFYGFATTLLLTMAVAIVASGDSRTHVVAITLIGLYGATVALNYRRAHAQLRASLQTASNLSQSEAASAREAGYLEALLASTPVAIATLNQFGTVSGINAAFESLFGYTADEVMGRRLNDLVVPESGHDEATRLDTEVQGGGTVVSEVDRRHKDGTIIPVRASAAVATGAAEGTMFVLYDDIRDLRAAEAARQDAEVQYRQIVESASDLVFELDRATNWTFLNAASRRFYAADPDELLGSPFAERVDESHVRTDLAALQDVLGGATHEDHETVHRSVSGEPRHLSFSFQPLRERGKVVGVRGTARDVTERAHARAALEEARLTAERAADTKSAFLANMSHEIRTPMNGILGMTELMLDSDLNGEQRRSLEIVRGSAEALLTVINDVLDFSKYDSGQFELEEIEFDLPNLLESTVRLLGTHAVDRDIELVCDIAPNMPGFVRGDPGRVRQVVTNLLGNALKFTHQGEVVLSASVDGDGNDPVSVIIAVRDTGIGIPADRIDAIFEDFSQADVSTTRRYGGTGLGLAISKQLIQRMGGDIEVRSEEGVGSTFRFGVQFPVAHRPEHADRSLRDTTVIENKRVLVVDDNATNRRVLSRMVEDVGGRVDAVKGAREAVTALSNAQEAGHPYDLGIIDVYMPDRDGFQLVADIREDETIADTRLMMLTSGGQRGDGQRCRDLGVDAYLTKPLSRTDLVEAAAAVLSDDTHEATGGLITRHSLDETRERVKVLLAEDNPVNQQVASAMLRKRGHDVRIVNDGQQAVDAASTGHFDVILMDVQMPMMDGFQATREIRKLPGYATTPIVALTAHALSEERDRCLAAGMNVHLAKPFKAHELFEVVEQWKLSRRSRSNALDSPGESVDPIPVDIDGFRAQMREAGIEDAVPNMLAVFLNDAPGRMAALRKAVDDREARAIEASAHAFKSAAATIGAHELAALLKEIEHAGRDGSQEQWQRLAERVEVASATAVAFVEGAVSTATAV